MIDSKLSIGDVIEVTTDRLAYGGEAVARHDGLAVFIPLAAPKEKLRVRITERKRSFARAVIDEVLEPSPSRRHPPCRYFGECGGCQFQHLIYEAQLEAKAGFVRDALERIGRLDWPHEIEIISAAEFGYRTRTQVKIDWRSARVGFNRARSNAVCDVESCPILGPELNKTLGSLRAVVACDSVNQPGAHPAQVEMAAGDSGTAIQPPIAGIPGNPLTQVVNGNNYKVDPSTFFQGNSLLIADLIEVALGDDSGDFGIDLFAGVGLFTIPMARRFKRVIGVESDPRAAKFAFDNIEANRTQNVEFQTVSVERWLEHYLVTNSGSPDLVLLDPPRIGAAESVALISKLKPRRISYVSCDPATLARDLRVLVDSGYNLSRITAIELFPQTYHVETVVTLARS